MTPNGFLCSTALTSLINLLSFGSRDSNLGRLGVERERYLCAMPTPMTPKNFKVGDIASSTSYRNGSSSNLARVDNQPGPDPKYEIPA